MMPSIVFYGSVLFVLVGLVSLAWPLARVGIRTRARAILVLGLGLALALATSCTPVSLTRVTPPGTRLDEYSPQYHVHEVHGTQVHATPDRTYAAIKAVTADEIALFQMLTWIRRFGQPGPESIINAPGQQPLLDVATRTSFLLLADDPPREVVVGTVVLALRDVTAAPSLTPATFRELAAPGFVKATMNFRVEPEGSDRSRVTTETRVFGTDQRAIVRFLPYWRIIYPGSALIRVTWLNAIKRRAEASTRHGSTEE